MSEAEKLTPEVRRVLARDDLLTIAAAADRAVGIVRAREDLSRQTKDEDSLFALALKHHLGVAQSNEAIWSTKAQAWDHAGVIVRFGHLVGIPVECRYTAEALHANALRELVEHDSPAGGPQVDKDLTLGVFNRYHAARNLRLAGRYEEALPLVMRPQRELYGTGAEPHMAHYLFERGANYIIQGQAAQLTSALLEWDEYWEKTRAAGYSTRYRFDFIRALALWDDDAARTTVLERLGTALDRARNGVSVPVLTASGELKYSEDDQGGQELSVTLAMAECLADGELTPAARADAVLLGTQALAIADRVRGRWRVIARSRAPLAVVFQRVYGDIALLAARLPGPAAAELGLRVALSAKQTGFAARLRAGRTLMNPLVCGLLDEIVEIEDKPKERYGGDRETDANRLKELHDELRDKLSPMLADTVLPPPTNLNEVTKVLGSRYALDYLELPDTLDNEPKLIRTLLRPGRPTLFERFDPDPGPREFFEHSRHARDLAAGISRDIRIVARDGSDLPPRPDWYSLAQAVLPRPLLDDVEHAKDRAVPLLISGHSWLSLVPWAALKIDKHGTRLVQRALITQCPVLTCLSFTQTPPVDGPALIRLVGRDEHGVDVELERQAWGYPESTNGVPLSRCETRSGLVPTSVPDGRLTKMFKEKGNWAFLHIASHGDHDEEHEGLNQVLAIPNESLSAARALGLHWPTSVLMASCHVGQVVNAKDAEPLNFVMAMLTGGARCVVAGIAAIHDRETGKAASHMVRAIRRDGVPLDVALRNAQLAAVERGAPETGWALLSSYAR